jgi:hypothetical protein
MLPGQLDRSADGCTTPDFRTNDNDATSGNETTISPLPTTTHHKDIHPNISSVLGTGPGFIDQFNTNPHTEKRSRNLYHPFSSKEEWGLTSWLLSSRLSMKDINSFLALPIVSSKSMLSIPH